MRMHYKHTYIDYCDVASDELLSILFSIRNTQDRYQLLKQLLSKAKRFKRIHARMTRQFTVHTGKQHTENISAKRDRLIRLGIIRIPKHY